MAKGGFFASKGWNEPTDEEGSSHHFAILWGEVVKGPDVSYHKKTCVKFVIKWDYGHTKRGGPAIASGYRLCEAWGDTPATRVMANVKHGDTVLCFGEWIKRIHKKDKKLSHTFKVDVCVPMELVEAAMTLYNSRAVRNVMEADDAPDPIESMDYELEF